MTPHLFWVVTANITIDVESSYWRIICVSLSRKEADDIKQALDTQRDAFEKKCEVITNELNRELKELNHVVTIQSSDATREAWLAATAPLYKDAEIKKKALMAEIDMIDRRYEWNDHFTVTYEVIDSSDDPRFVPASVAVKGAQ